MELTTEQLRDNFNEFLTILGNAVQNRTGANWEGLKTKLMNSDFSTAPASTRFHGSFKGGLCYHSLTVYNNLKTLVKAKGYEDKISEDTIAIVSLLHDFAKINFYKETAKNVKVYSDTGSKHDELGKFDWVAQLGYITIPNEEKTFVYGSHEQNSEYMARYFIPLSLEESAAILHHHMGMDKDTNTVIPFQVAEKYPLVALLHSADFIAATVDKI